ncbi:MAG TPA: hypothetical protein VNV62_17590 [Trebonia sp.]|jgi:hypothetical protein|nr:hypothetical protein [Trebonia sp.]
MASPDDKDMALFALIPEETRRHMAPLELAVRVQAGRQLLADGELKGTEKSRTMRDVEKLMKSPSWQAFFTVAAFVTKVSAESTANVRDDLSREMDDLLRANPAAQLFFQLPQDVQMSILRELSGNSTGDAPERRPRKLNFGKKR